MNRLALSPTASKIIPFTVAIAFFINALDSFILNVAVPTVAQALHQPPLILKLAVTSYLLSMGVFIPISGWLANRYGTRNIFLLSIVLFGLGSLACGLSQNLWELVLSRLLQGIGGALMLPVGRLALNKIYPREEIFRLMAMVAMMGLLGPALGPVIGGVIVTYFSWRWIFFINLPFAFLGIVLIIRYMPNLIEAKVKRLDWLGFIFFGLSVGSIGLGFSAIGQQALPISLEFGLLLFGLICFGLYCRHHKRTPEPFIEMAIFRISTYRIAIIGGFVLRFAISAMSFLVALMCQLAFHLSPIKTALILLPYTVGLIVSKPFMKRVARAVGLKNILTYNSVILAVIMVLFAFLQPHRDLWLLLVNLFLFGISVSFEYTSLQTLNLVNGTQSLLGEMISFASAMQQVTASLSVAFAALILELFLHLSGQVFTVTGFHVTFLLNSVFIVIATFIFVRLKAGDGAEFTGYQPSQREDSN